MWLYLQAMLCTDTVVCHQDQEDSLGPSDFDRPDREDNRRSFADSLRATVGNGARALSVRLGRSRKTLIRTLPIIDQ